MRYWLALLLALPAAAEPIDTQRLVQDACRHVGMTLGVSQQAADYRAGDIVTWDLGLGLSHIGLVSDRHSAVGVPLILHNIGAGAQEEDLLFAYRITGHYRFAP